MELLFSRARAGCEARADLGLDRLKTAALGQQPRRTRDRTTRTNLPDFGLDELDQLDEVVRGIHAEERQEPRVERCRGGVIALLREVKEPDGLDGESVDESGDPAGRTGGDPFDDEIVDADEERETGVWVERADPGEATNIGG
jgi:hypothetical protein